ncbi:MAG: GTPase ObgE [Clostridiales bacterium]
MFIDSAHIYIKAGDGGDGSVSFRREKYVANGGPDGGDGGKGGNIVFQADNNLRTLVDFKYKRKYVADSGQKGSGANCSGRNGKDTIIKVPRGTIIRDSASKGLIADLIENKQEIIIAKGGKGGKGNQHFATATRQIPTFARAGIEGEEVEVDLELKVLADVGLIGMPNVGKSTLLSIISKAKPKIANYHFTTLQPNLGVVKIGEGTSFTVADIPGLIEGAHEGLGLGHEFLKHIERTKILVHLIDLSGSEGRDPIEDFEKINLELEQYSEKLSGKLQIIVANKTDLIYDNDIIDGFTKEMKNKGYEVFAISAATTKGVNELFNRVSEIVDSIEDDFSLEEVHEVKYIKKDEKLFTIKKENRIYIIEGQWVKRIFKSINTDSYDALKYFQRVLKQKGVISELEKMGIEENETVKIEDFEFDYIK